jgi:hypothetical protein
MCAVIICVVVYGIHIYIVAVIVVVVLVYINSSTCVVILAVVASTNSLRIFLLKHPLCMLVHALITCSLGICISFNLLFQ